MADTQENGTAAPTTWSDVQRLIAISLVFTFSFSTIALTIRLIIWGDPPTLVDLAKTFQAALINMSMVVLGYFFGSSKSKDTSDASQQKVVDKLTSTNPPNGGPVAPLAAPIVVVSWLSLLKPEEKAAIDAAAATDPQVKTALTNLESGKAEAPDLAVLVSKGLLTPERSNAIQGV